MGDGFILITNIRRMAFSRPELWYYSTKFWKSNYRIWSSKRFQVHYRVVGPSNQRQLNFFLNYLLNWC